MGCALSQAGARGVPDLPRAALRWPTGTMDGVAAMPGHCPFLMDLQTRTLRDIRVQGEQRIAKVLPGTRHDALMAPAAQYPAGGGGLQWSILPPGLPFLAAAEVRADGTVAIPGRVLDLASGEYAARATLRQYLTMA